MNSNREYQQTTTTERHFGIGTPPDNNSEYLTPRESFYSCKNSLPQQSETTSFASVHSSVTGSTEFMYMTPPNGQPGNMISSPQKPVVDLNIRVQSKQGLSHSTFESFLHLDLQSFQSSDTSELPDQSHTLDASMSSTSFQEAVRTKQQWFIWEKMIGSQGLNLLILYAFGHSSIFSSHLKFIDHAGSKNESLEMNLVIKKIEAAISIYQKLEFDVAAQA